MQKPKESIKLKLTISFTLIMIIAGLLLTACGEEYTVSIMDRGERTEMLVKSGIKVSTVLEDAQIKLGEKDEVIPALDERIKEPVEIEIKRYAEVTVIDLEGKEHSVALVGGTVTDAVEEAGITLAEGQITSEEPDAFLQDGMEITIIQQSLVNITADGETKEVYTSAQTVGELLEEQQITLGENDRIEPAVETAVEEKMSVVVQRVEIKEETETETIEYSTEVQKTSSMASGTSKVKQNGEDGEKEVKYQVTYVDGTEESREVLEETVTKEPVTKIILKGTKKTSSSSGTSSGGDTSGSSGGDSSDSGSSGGKTVTSEQYLDDCDGSGHGVKITTYSDGTTDETEY